MTKRNRLFAFLLALILGIGPLAGCGGATNGGDSSASATSSSSSASAAETMDLSGVTDPYLATAGVSGDAVGATVGDYEITMDDLLYWLNYGAEVYLEQYVGSYDEELPWDTELDGQTLKEFLFENALETAAFYRMIPVLAQREGLTVSQEDADYLAQDFTDSAQQIGSEELLDHVLWYELRTRDQYTRTYEAGVLYQALQELYYGENSGNYPTDAQVRAYIEDEGYYRIKYILLKVVDTDQQVENEDGTASYAPLSEEEIAEKRALAQDILAQLQSSDDPATLFDQLMEEYNEDPVYSYYPDGYDLYQGDPVMPQLEEAALALKEGEISPMIESDYGFYIVLRLPADLDSFRSELVAQYMEDRFDQEIAQLEVKTNQVWEELDAAAFRTQVMALQAAVQEEVQNAE